LEELVLIILNKCFRIN